MRLEVRMTCLDALRMALEADDGATDPELRRTARRHVAYCPRCAGALDDHRGAELAEATLRTVIPRRGRLHAVLIALGIGQLLLAVPWVLGLNPIQGLAGAASASHLARDGALGMIVGVAALLTAVAPRHAMAMLVTTNTAVVVQALGFAVDQSSGAVAPLYEMLHLVIPVIVFCVGLVALRRPRLTGPTRPPRLHIVRDIDHVASPPPPARRGGAHR
jgi:hypothetical protein